MLNEIDYKGCLFYIYWIESDKIYICDENGNKVGFLYKKEIKATGNQTKITVK